MANEELKNSIVDLTLVLHHETDKAILVSESEDVATTWLPLSQVEVGTITTKHGVRFVELQVPEWLAQKHGLI